jgi:hypothetical protein
MDDLGRAVKLGNRYNIRIYLASLDITLLARNVRNIHSP